MRKQPRSAALLAVLFMSTIPLAAESLLAPAAAHERPSRREPEPATPENLERLRQCESGDDYDRNARNRYFGAYQFSVRTWRSLGYDGMPHEAPAEIQDEAAERLQARSGWRPWPACSRKLGLR